MKALLAALVVALVLSGCSDKADQPGAQGGSSGSQPTAGVQAGHPIWFEDVTKGSGITLKNISGDPYKKMAISENIGQGAAALDFDNDGLLDLYIANGDVYPGTNLEGSRNPALYRNEGNFHFRDVTREAGLEFKGWAHGAHAVDFDGDGHTDLYVTVEGGPNRFYRNLGDGHFEDRSATWGGNDAGPSCAAAFFDADQDGDLDLYVGNYVVYDPKNPPNKGQPCIWKRLEVSCGPRGTEAGKDTFYENVNGKLQDATAKFGFDQVVTAYTLGVATGDLDNDGDLDLYVANDSVKNYMFENLGGGHFEEKALGYGIDRNKEGKEQAGMGLDLGDVDNDGRLDIFITNFSQDYNTLYHNYVTPAGVTYFKDDSGPAGLVAPALDNLSWGCRLTDLDRDGLLDIIVASGHVYPQVDGAGLGTSYAQLNQVYRCLGRRKDGVVHYENLGARAGPGFQKKSVTRGLVTADLDNDGDLDLLMVELDQTPTLLRNDGQPTGRWIGFSLVGKGKNREAIGARLKLTDSAGVTRMRERMLGASYMSTQDPRLLFGLGQSAERISRLEVRWPDGQVQTHKNLATGRYWTLDQAAGTAQD